MREKKFISNARISTFAMRFRARFWKWSQKQTDRKKKIFDWLISGCFPKNRPKTEIEKSTGGAKKQRRTTTHKRQPSADGLGRRLYQAVSSNLKHEEPLSSLCREKINTSRKNRKSKNQKKNKVSFSKAGNAAWLLPTWVAEVAEEEFTLRLRKKNLSATFAMRHQNCVFDLIFKKQTENAKERKSSEKLFSGRKQENVAML